MNWIKKHYDQFALGIVGAAVLTFAILLYLKTQSFGERFTEALAEPIPNEKVPPVKLDQIDRAKDLLAKSPGWTVPDMNNDEHRQLGSLFVSDLFLIGPDNTPKKPVNFSLYKDSLTQKDIPNRWFLENNLPLLDPTVPKQDPDKDGFLNEDEWRWKTDPNGKDSHPPYYSKLFLKGVIRVPFRLKFQGYDGDARTGRPETFSFQINTIDLRQPSEFLKLGETVAHTKFRLEKFEYKTKKNDGTGEEEDVSELTVVNTETNDKAVLILNRVVDSPDYYVLFDYQWPQPAIEIRVKKLGVFVLRPNAKEIYKLVDIKIVDGKEYVAVVQLPEGLKTSDGASTLDVTRDPRKK